MIKAFALFYTLLFYLSAGASETPESNYYPKYGPEITLLQRDPSFIRTHEAPDYWALSPYYSGQHTDSSCSVATAAMIVNGARKDWNFANTEHMAIEEELLARTGDTKWTESTRPGGKGYGLESLGKALEAYGVKKYRIEMFSTPDESLLTYDRMMENLRENEKSGNNFIAINFVQGIATGDALFGHWAVIGAYDDVKDRVLILDPDRDWYEPYWISTKTLLKAMAFPHKGFTRGYVFVHIL